MLNSWIKTTHVIYQLKNTLCLPICRPLARLLFTVLANKCFLPLTWMKYLIESHTHTHTELVEHMQVLAWGGQQADVFISSGQSHWGRHCSALTRSEQQRHLNHFNGFIVWSLRHTRKDYYDCICPAPVISVCVVASQGHVSLWLKKPL